jgi:divalent metal cation (Fe/Co/Zn/Cd) transporter
VDSALSIDEAHRVGMVVESRIKESIEGVKEVVVHMEPKDFCELQSENGHTDENGS